MAIVARDGGTCEQHGCDEPWWRCDVDHRNDWTLQGCTDLPNLGLEPVKLIV
jgi:hypothetical protein